MQEDRIEFKFELEAVTNKFLLHLKTTTDCLTHIYYAVEKSNFNIYKPLPTDNLPIVIDDNKPKLTVSEQKQITLNWALTNAFGDLLNGLTKSFKELYKILKLYSLSQEPKYSRTKESLEKEVQTIDKQIEEFSIPTFIDKIEMLLTKPLLLRDEIISINKIRNCLVHRHGVVSEKDIKDSISGNLTLKWISFVPFSEIEGQLTQITYDLRKDGIALTNLSHVVTSQQKVFSLEEKIILDINEFNGIATTCGLFANELFNLLPKQ